MGARIKKGGKIQRWEAALDNPQRALRQIGVLMVAESQRAFAEQRFGSESWAPRSNVNVMGIIADFAMGRRSPPARRFQPRPALQDTGQLMRSISHQLISQDTVEVGTNLPYAPVHHKGGESQSEVITAKVQDLLWKWLRKQSKDLKERLGWLLNKKFRGQRITAQVPARRIVGISRQTEKDIQDVVKVSIMEVQ